MPYLSKDCGPRCRSKQHAGQLVVACTKGSTRQLQLYLSRCYNIGGISDVFGRNVLHMLASKGRWEVVLWLLEEKKVDLAAKDLESGWTALHRSLFYGQISSARILIAHGANLHVRDKEGLTPLDLTMKNRLPHVEFTSAGLYETYTWGDNSNFTLGHDTEQRKRHPEPIDYFRKRSISVKQVVMNKYHSVFLSADGKVYTCGHGRGGRLGQANQQTYLTPKLVENIQSQICEKIAAARDHTLMLMDNGNVYSCGLNESHQLGLFPPPENSLIPRQINAKCLKGKAITGICAQRFHTVLYSDRAIYTFGLNAGQLGHLKVQGEVLVSQPRMVSAFNHKDFSIKHVTASDAATVVVNAKRDVFVLHEYQCRKIASRWLDIQQIAVSGGHLDHRSDLDTLREKGGNELVILILNSAGKIFIWRSLEPTLKRCMWSIKRALHITQLSLSVQNFVAITDEGAAFKATIPKKKQKEASSPTQKETILASSPPADTFTMSVTDLLEKEETEHVPLERIAIIHRAVNITVDNKGNNFCALQALPNASLTEIPTIEDSKMVADYSVLMQEANECDLIHDVILEVNNHRLPAHKYILASKSEYFRKVFTEKEEEVMPGEKTTAIIDNVNYEIFLQMIKYIYTDTCDVLKIGNVFNLAMDSRELNDVDVTSSLMDIDIPTPTYEVSQPNKQSAFEVRENTKRKKKKVPTATLR